MGGEKAEPRTKRIQKFFSGLLNRSEGANVGPYWRITLRPTKVMDYVKGILSGLVAIIIAELVPGSWSVVRGMSGSKATGLAAVAGGLIESILSPLFWILALALFVLFFAASRLENKLLRIFLFWIPTLTVSSFGLAIVALITCLIVLAGHP
jgi:hypothetical protein